MQSKTHKTRHATPRGRHAKPISVSITRTPEVANHLRQRQPDARELLIAAVEEWPSLISDREFTSTRQRKGASLGAASSPDAPMKDPPQVNRILSTPGQQLNPNTRHLMERRFGADFSRVRIHSGASAAQSARMMAANAYTMGQNIVFGEGQYAPNSPRGQRLLAHELAHTIQQRGLQRSPIGSLLSTDDRSLETEADLAATAIATGTRLPSLRRAHRPVVQCQSSPTSTYNIQLTYPPNHTERHDGLILPDALRVLRRFADRISAHLEGGYEGHRYLQEIHEDQFIVAGVSDLFGGRSFPSLFIWAVPRARLQNARRLIADGDVARATTQLQQAASETRDAERRVIEYREGSIEGAERAIFALQVLEVAGAAAATVVTGGTGGALYVGAQRFAGEATSVALGLQDEIDWGGIAFDTLFALVAGRFGGQLGGKIAARLGGTVAARVISSVIVGRASGIAHSVAREVFDAARGRTELTLDGFMDRLATQLSARAIFLDLVAHAVGSVGQPRGQTGTPNEPTRPAAQRPQLIQGGNRAPVQMRGGRVVSPARRTTQGGRGGPSARGRGGAAPAVEPEPVVEPAVQPVREVPQPVQEPIRAANPPGSQNPAGSVGQAVAVGAVVSSAQQQQPPPRNMPTGLTSTLADAIPLTWFKHLSYYPDTIFLGGHPYDMMVQTNLPLGEEIGVFHENLPSLNKIVQLVPEPRNPNRVRQFRTTLANYGFNWGPYEADHIQDLQWSGLDRHDNLWPMEAVPNGLAGPRQNQNQPVTYYPQYNSPATITRSVQQGRNSTNPTDNLNLRFFKISTIRRL